MFNTFVIPQSLLIKNLLFKLTSRQQLHRKQAVDHLLDYYQLVVRPVEELAESDTVDKLAVERFAQFESFALLELFAIERLALFDIQFEQVLSLVLGLHCHRDSSNLASVIVSKPS